jgi:hypothetical protein
VIAFWVVYGVLHAALRLGISSTLIIDDARANELTQTLALGYQVRQPPLYEWLLWCSQQVLGTGLPSHLLVRYSLIALFGIATFAAVRAAVKDDRWAAAASLSLAFAYPVGWTFHEWGTQTILLCIACMLTVQAALTFLERPSLGSAIFLGLAVALGLYAKLSYPLFLLALLFALLSIRETRAKLADARLLVSLAVAIIAVSPYVYWVISVHGDVVSDISTHLVASTQSHLSRAMRGLERLALGIPTHLLPWLMFVALLAPRAFLPARAGTPSASIAERMTLRTMIFAVVLAAIGIAALGATRIGARYMHPLLIIAPIYIFARVVRLSPGDDVLRRFAVLAVFVALVVLGVRFIAATDNPVTRMLDRALNLPFEELTAALKERGITEGTVLTPDVREAGNLRAFNPEFRVIAADSLRAERPPRRDSDARSCILLWAEWQNTRVKDVLERLKPAVVEVSIPAPDKGIIASRDGKWLIVRLDPQSDLCR